MSASLANQSAELIEDFEFLEDWSARYAYLIELGEKLPAMDDVHRTEANRVKGCMSQVWVEAIERPDGRIDFTGDCDTAIIKGILAVLIELMSGHLDQWQAEPLTDSSAFNNTVRPQGWHYDYDVDSVLVAGFY
ncbi:MAG: SufE family protein, partial [Gammaproteobacteria bacterium]